MAEAAEEINAPDEANREAERRRPRLRLTAKQKKRRLWLRLTAKQWLNSKKRKQNVATTIVDFRRLAKKKGV